MACQFAQQPPRRRDVLLALAASLFLMQTDFLMAADEKPATLRVMSFNIRNSGESDGANGWAHRREQFFQTIADFKPDLFGIQEVLADQHDELTKRFSDYTFGGAARDDGRRSGEWALVAFRTDRFEKIDSGNFWLSETPDKPGTKSWDAACVRICSWVRLKDRQAGKELIFADTHWDHVGVIARRKAAELIRKRLPALSKGAPVILAGDLNSTEDDDWVQALLHPTGEGEAKLADTYREVHPKRSPNEQTFHAFDGGITGSRIDFILHTPEFKATAADIDRRHTAEGRYPSDHFAVTGVLEWR